MWVFLLLILVTFIVNLPPEKCSEINRVGFNVMVPTIAVSAFMTISLVGWSSRILAWGGEWMAFASVCPVSRWERTALFISPVSLRWVPAQSLRLCKMLLLKSASTEGLVLQPLSPLLDSVASRVHSRVRNTE